MNENRYNKNWKDNYPFRKEAVERTFADCKEQWNLDIQGYRKMTNIRP